MGYLADYIRVIPSPTVITTPSLLTTSLTWIPFNIYNSHCEKRVSIWKFKCIENLSLGEPKPLNAEKENKMRHGTG